MRRRNTDIHAAAVGALGNIGAPQAIGEVTNAFLTGSVTVRKVAATSLLQILPLLTDEHYGTLSADSIIGIAHIASQRDRVLAGKALEALELVGTPAAIPNVERALAKAPTQELRDAVQRVLEVLREREMLERNANTLLRPATAPRDDTLLHPAGNAEVREDLLLIPSEKSDA